MLNEARFYLLMDSGKGNADVMAECSLCGAITRQPLALTWLERSVACSNCGIVMPFDVLVLDKLRQQGGRGAGEPLTSYAAPRQYKRHPP